MSVMNWEDGKLFLAVARAGQMLGAAKALGLNQATLSRRMTALENNLGTKLLTRRTTGCDLTEHGREMMKSLEQAEGIFLASQAAMGPKPGNISGTVRIGAPDGFGALFLAPRLAKLKARHPELSIQLVPVPRSFSLSQREADIAVMIGRPTQGRLVARKLTDYSLSLYASSTYLKENGTPQKPEELGRHNLVGYVDDLLYAPSLNYVDSFLPNWKSSIEVSTAVGQLQAVMGGAGIGIMHDYLAADCAGIELVLPQKRVVRDYWTVFHESQRDLPRIRAIAAFLIDTVTAERASFTREPNATDVTNKSPNG